MSAESIQRPLFDDPIGQRFILAREKARLSKPSVAKQLRLPLVVIEAIENEDWARLGAPIYVRSYIGSYARLLGLPPETGEDIACGKPLPALVPIAIRSRARHLWDRSAFNLASLATSAVIVGSIALLAAHFNAPARIAQTLPLDSPSPTLDSSDAFASPATTQGPTAPDSAIARAPAGTPLLASLAPVLPVAQTAASGSGELILRFGAESWVDIVDAQGRRVEHGLIAAGSERRYAAGQASRILLGDAEAVQVSLDGRAVDLAPYREANIVRFTVSSQGRITPPGG